MRVKHRVVPLNAHTKVVYLKLTQVNKLQNVPVVSHACRRFTHMEHTILVKPQVQVVFLIHAFCGPMTSVFSLYLW